MIESYTLVYGEGVEQVDGCIYGKAYEAIRDALGGGPRDPQVSRLYVYSRYIWGKPPKMPDRQINSRGIGLNPPQPYTSAITQRLFIH